MGDRTAHLSRVVAGAGLLLLAVTWRLWTPQEVFPQVPLFAWARLVPAVVDWAGLLLMAAGLGCAAVASCERRVGRIGLVVFALSAAGMVLLDQHRLQPWAYQLGVAAVVLACAPRGRTLFLLRVLTISLYFHSALSKLDFSFLETNGQLLVQGVLEPVGLSMKFWSEGMRRGAAAVLPLGELGVALLLAVPRLRRWGLYGSWVMHGVLLLALGPWGLNHQPAVLVWNVYFIVQNWFLFRRELEEVSTAEDMNWSRRWVDVVVWAVVLLPLLEPWGLWDVWPSWGVYAAHPAEVRVYVDEDVVEALPESVRAHAGPREAFSRWRRVRIDRWSLEGLGVPVYPEDRFQLGVAVGLPGEVRVVILGRADRCTGERVVREVVGREAILKEADGFWLNVRVREVVGW